MKLYTNEGWVNWDYIFQQPEPITAIVGARGVGKTYGLMKKLVEEKKRFIYLRRLKSQLDECKKATGNPFKRLNSDLGLTITPYPAGGTVAFREGDKNSDIVAVGVALSVVANIRGVDFSDYDYILYDEFISSEGERPIKEEFAAFQNFYETVNRNRELLGEAPVRCFLLGNANRIANPYFAGWHLMRRTLNMIRGGQMVWRSPDKTIMLVLLLHSPISEKKADTILYKNASSDFAQMALDNAFRTDETVIKSVPLKEYTHIVSIGEIGIYQHKSERKYYVSATTCSAPYYDPYGIGLAMFQQDYYMLRTYYMVYKNVVFESFELEIIFREMIGLK